MRTVILNVDTIVFRYGYDPSGERYSKITAIFQSASTGKEKDSETGYYYFGARYYNADLSLWLSVDPMSDKYPSLSPYNYCAWNPMKIVDPDGMDTFYIHLDRGRIYKQESEGNHSVQFIKNGKRIEDRTIMDIKTKINYTRGDDWPLSEGVGHTDYLEFEDAMLGKNVFDIAKDESTNSNSAKEWDYYFYKQGGGELSSSGRSDIMGHEKGRYTSQNVKGWHHFHPDNTYLSWFPSISDQERSRYLGVPSYLYNGGEVRRFDEVVRPRNLNPTAFGRIFGLCH